jgi:hypothetical protein
MQSIETACRVCGSPCSDLWNAPLLDLSVRYMHCARCGYVQTEQPYWLDRAYGDSINSSDTGIMARNLRNSHVVLATLLALGNWHQRVVDFAGGYGILTRLLRDYGVEALWSDRFSENLLARGFEHSGESAGLVTAFEAFEHFVNPKSSRILPRLPIDGGITAGNMASTSGSSGCIRCDFSRQAARDI